MNTKLFKLLTAGTFALLSACGDNVVEYNDNLQGTLPSDSLPGDSTSNPVQTKATLNVLVRDASTGVPLDAKVKLLSTGDSAITDIATGTASFKDVFVGNHSVLVEKAGYASAVGSGAITATPTENLFIATDFTSTVSLYPLTSGIDGYVFYEDTSGVSKPAANADVRIIVNDIALVNRIFTAKASADGKFVFSGLPAVGNNYVIQFLDWGTYKAKEFSGYNLGSLSNGLTVHITNTIKYAVGDLNALFELVTYKPSINSTETLNLIFSDSIDAQKFKPSMVTARDNSNNNNIIITDKIVAGDTLKLVPLGTTGKWPSNFSVIFNSLTAVSGKTYNGSISDIEAIDLTAPFELVKYRTLFEADKADTTLLLIFSVAIDTADFNPEKVYFINGNSNYCSQNVISIPSDKKVAGDTIKLTPLNKWPSSFRVCFDQLKSANAKTYPSTPTNEIKVASANLSDLQVTELAQTDTSDYNSSSVTLKWKKLAGATGYRIYARASAGTKKEEFVNITSTDDPINDTIYNVNLSEYIYIGNNTGGNYRYRLLGLSSSSVAFAKGDSIEFVVQAYNNSSETKLNGAAKVAVKDKKKPIWVQYSYTTTNFWTQAGADSVAMWYGYYPDINNCSYYDDDIPGYVYFYCESGGMRSGQISEYKFDRLKYATADQYNQVTLYFSEPMDTTKATINYDEKPDRFTVNKSWLDSRTLILTPTIAAGTVFKQAATFRVQIKDLQDLAGNRFAENYLLAGARTKPTNDLEFRFVHLENPAP